MLKYVYYIENILFYFKSYNTCMGRIFYIKFYGKTIKLRKNVTYILLNNNIIKFTYNIRYVTT